MSDIAILVVEDNTDHLELTVMAFRECIDASRIATAETGEQALDFMFARGDHADRDKRRPPRLVVLDMKLGGMDGVDVLRAIRADPLTQAVPVVMLSASTERQALDRCYEAGANSVVRKSQDNDELNRKIKQVYEFWMTVNEAHRNSRV